jgi:hypothetical protein
VVDEPDKQRHGPQAEAVTTQARWLYELHTKRAESAQQRATTIIALAGVLLTLAPKALTEVNQGWQRALLVGTLAASAVTIALALAVLRPKPTGAPSVYELRERWGQYRQDAKSDLVVQVAEDLLRSSTTGELSAAEFAKTDADHRIRKLKHAYWVLTVALGLTATLTTVAAFQGGNT